MFGPLLPRTSFKFKIIWSVPRILEFEEDSSSVMQFDEGSSLEMEFDEDAEHFDVNDSNVHFIVRPLKMQLRRRS